MHGIIEYLNDPALVARFQNFCGVFPKKERIKSDAPENGTHQTTISNGNGKSENIHQNGNLRSRDNLVRENSSGSGSESEREEETDYIVTRLVLYYIMRFGTELGNEGFFIFFWPYWLWNVDGYVCRRVCLFWSIIMYIGQATKDIVRWPRPSSPPVFRMEARYALEYGFPSTHAMVGAGIPFALLYFTMQRYIYPFEYGVLVCLLWATVVSISRIYLGMHSVLDVLAGLVYVFLLMPFIFPLLDIIDEFALHHPYSPFFVVTVPFLLCLLYPPLDQWSTARGDTTVTVGVSTGVYLGHWISFQQGFMHKSSSPPPYPIIPPTMEWLGLMGMRLVIGVLILFASRAIVKAVTHRMACRMAGVGKNDTVAHQRLVIELPYKFITYTSLAFNCIYLAPRVFRILGIERETFFTEL